jgi:hypothetical protein
MSPTESVCSGAGCFELHFCPHRVGHAEALNHDPSAIPSLARASEMDRSLRRSVGHIFSHFKPELIDKVLLSQRNNYKTLNT